ncbi:diguanylate cyclase domain-containing protein [Deinococcus hohokamensis]|uniref:Diguanylate cyclase domain-containing protein n=1 Tax=Deinococcus hohokamensis TaxID=309883 RepID=A0ABV9IDK3_9DEIO
MTSRILLIEDDPDITNVVTYDLEQAGYQVHTAVDGESGLNAAVAQAPDLVLLDLGLPDISGHDVTRQLRAQSDVPVIVLTAMDASEQKVELLRAGANDYVVKPFCPDELIARVEVQLRDRPVHRREPPALSDGLSQLTAGLAHSPNGVVITANTPEFPVVYCNGAFERLTGQTSRELLGTPGPLPGNETADPARTEQLLAALRRGETTDLTMEQTDRNGRTYWTTITLGPVSGSAGEITHFMGVYSDVTHQVARQQELERHAFTDALTGLPNRAQLLRELQHEAAPLESQERFALAFIDLDGFKDINDQWGHAAGDELLRQVGQRLRGAVRNIDLPARLGGDEFVVLLRHIESDEALELVTQRILGIFHAPIELDIGSVKVGGSVGVVRHLAGETANDLLMRADQQMYGVKRCRRPDAPKR